MYEKCRICSKNYIDSLEDDMCISCSYFHDEEGLDIQKYNENILREWQQKENADINFIRNSKTIRQN